MSNFIDLIYSKEAIAGLKEAHAELDKTNKLINEMSKKSLDFFGGTTPKNPAQMQKVIADFQKMEQASEKTKAKLVQNIFDEQKARESLQKQKEQHFKKEEQSILKQLAAEDKANAKKIADSERIIKQKEKEFSKFERDFNKYEANLAKQAISEEKARKKQIQAILDQSKALQSLEKQKQREINEANKEQAKLNQAANTYNKLQVELNKLSFAYKELAARQERGATLSRVEAERMDYLGKRIKTLDTTLKGIDGAMGKYQRNVGNYAGSFNPLSNSINQLTREMPAFTYSVQTGFMAISNNLPIFFDAMQQVIAQNKELQAQGKPTQSVLKQVASSLLSFQTLLGVGITLLTVYGKEIGNWVSELFGASNALSELNKRQKEFNEAKFTGRKDAQSEIIELRKYLAVVKDVKVSDEERLIALKALRSQFPFYFKNLTDAQIFAGNYANAEKDLTLALEKRKEVEKKTELNVTNKQRLLDLEKEKTSLEERLPILEKNFKAQEKMRGEPGQAGLYASSLIALSSARKSLSAVNSEINITTAKMIENDSDIFKLKKETIALEYQEEKQRKEKLKQLQELTLTNEDYEASLYALQRRQLELESESAKRLNENESQEFDVRLNAYSVFVQKRQEIAILDQNEQIRLEEKRVSDLKASALQELNDTISQEGATAKLKADARLKYNSYVETLEKQSVANIKLINLNHTNEVLDIWQDFYKKQDDLRRKQAEQSELKSINEQELNDLREYNKQLLNIDKKSTLQRINEIEKIKTDAVAKAQIERLQLELRGINDRLEKESEGTEAWNKLNDQRIAKQKELTNIVISESEKQAAAQKKYLEEVASYLKGFVSDFAGQSGFQTLFKILNKEITGFGENVAVTANTLLEVFQEMYAFMNQNSEAFFQREYERLSTQKDIALKYAGESSVAREEIERQYEERRKQIDRQRAEQQKRQAMFNIAINTAQGVVAALASVPPNVPLSIAIGVIGAAQLAAVASQQIPAYAEGTQNHAGGLMLINDGKGSNYKETVVTPDGKAKQYSGRNVVTSAPKGTKVYTHDQWNERLNGILVNAGIKHSNYQIPEINNGLTASEMDGVLGKYFSNLQTNQTIIDKNGFNDFVIKGGQKTKKISTRVSFKGLNT